MKSTIVFVYNANSGLFNTLADVAHKVLSPQTYPCNLCAITNSALGMRKEWKQFLERLDEETEFLHRDQLAREYEMENVELPAVFRRRGRGLNLLVDAESINRCGSIEDLKRLLTEELSKPT